jgi:hypothetical protein
LGRGRGGTTSGRRAGAAALASCALLSTGCGRAVPAAASALGERALEARALTIVSGDTRLPVAGAEVVVGGQRWTTDEAGHVPVPANALGAVDVAADGFLSRQTRLGAQPLTLWPVGPGREADYVRAIIYRSSAAGGTAGHGAEQPLQRVAAGRVVLMPSRAVVRDGEAMAALRRAIAEINDATGGRVAFSLGGSTFGAAVFATEVDARLPWVAATYKRLEGQTIVGGRVVMSSLPAARSARFLAHELGHTLGLQHSAAPSDLMYFEARAGGPSTFTAAERLTMRLLLQRRPGNHYPDNDRDDRMDGLTVSEAVVVEPSPTLRP